MMAADLDQAYTRWAHEELSDPPCPPHEQSIAQMLDHGSISFGRFAIESLSWEKRSVFTHNRRQEELEKFKAPGLVAQKKAYFEEYYKKIRSLKALAGDSQQAGEVIDGGSDDIHSQTAADDGCESTLTSMKSLNDASTVSNEKFSYENHGNQESDIITDSGHCDSEATTSFSNSLGQSIDEMELERNSSNISQITNLESDSLIPYIVQPKANEMEIENCSSNVSQITQIDTDSVTQFLVSSEANLDGTYPVPLEIKSESAFHTNSEELDLLVHDECGKGLVENENLNSRSEINTEEFMMGKHAFEFSGVSRLMDVDHKVSEPSESNFATEPKETTALFREQTKMVARPLEAKMKKSTTSARSIVNQELSNRPGSSRSLQGLSREKESGRLARMIQVSVNRPASSRSHQGPRNWQDSGSLARNKMIQVSVNRPASSRSHQGLGNRQESGKSERNNMNERPYSQISSSRSHQLPSNRQEVGTSTRNYVNQGSNNRPGSSISLKGSGNCQVSNQLERNSKNPGLSISNRPGSSRSLQGLSCRPGSSKSLQRPRNLPQRAGGEEGKVASLSNRSRMSGSDASSSCGTPKQVHSKVTIPQPFSFATEKRATTERRINDTPCKGDQYDNSNNKARRSATPFQTKSFSSSLNTPKKTASEIGVKENIVQNRHQTPRKSSVLESRLTANVDSQLRKPVHRSINLPASDMSDSIGKHSAGVENGTRLDKKEEKRVKTPLAKTKQSFKDGESLIKTLKPKIRKVTSSQTTHAAAAAKTSRQEVKRWR